MNYPIGDVPASGLLIAFIAVVHVFVSHFAVGGGLFLVLAERKARREALKSASRVWLATDCDREGQLIGQEILEHCRYRGQVMRVMFTAQDTQTIRDAFSGARPNSEYARLYAAAVARRQADQIAVVSRFKFTRDDTLETRVGTQ